LTNSTERQPSVLVSTPPKSTPVAAPESAIRPPRSRKPPKISS
jgi:hypothetical protein